MKSANKKSSGDFKNRIAHEDLPETQARAEAEHMKEHCVIFEAADADLSLSIAKGEFDEDELLRLFEGRAKYLTRWAVCLDAIELWN